MKKWLSALFISFTMLTRIPLPFQKKIHFNDENTSHSAAFFPLVGLFFGLVWVLAFYLLNLFTKDGDIQAFILLAIPYVMNNFFHLDGLTDTLDAFLADRTKKERLIIMKDSRTGSFALGGIFLFLLFKFLLIKKMLALPYFLPLFAAIPVFSRFGIVFLSFISKYPGKEGIGKSLIGRIKPSVLILASILTFLILLFVFFISGFHLLPIFIISWIITILVIVWIRFYSNKMIGGVTGDVLGASVEVLELLLFALCLILSRVGGIF